MQCVTDVDIEDRKSGVYVDAGAEFTAGVSRSPVVSLWCSTARTGDSDPGIVGTVVEKATRTAQSCFIRGLRERVTIATSSGDAWVWRRIVFRMKGTRFLEVGQDNLPPRELYFRNGTDGYARLVTDWFGTTASSTVFAILFKGTEGDDWPTARPEMAKVDTSRVSLMYDKTIRVASGNASGVERTYNMWHSPNKNLIYNDDEAGTTEVFSHFSTESNRGCGDMYVMDIIKPADFAATDARIRFTPQSALYWHER